MIYSSDRRQRISISAAAFFGLIFLLSFGTALQAQVLSDPRIAEFDPSPDHWAVLGGGQPAVVRYDLEMYEVGTSSPFATMDMGKPSPDADGKIRYDFSSAVASFSFPGGNYEARVSAVGPEGEALSDPSNPFTFSTPSSCGFSLNTTTVRPVAAGGSYSAQLSTGPTCGWTASTNLSWVTLYAVSGTGSGTVPFQVQPNTSTFGRTGVLTIGGQSLTVAQDGAAPTKTTPSIAWTAPAPITQGTALGSAQLNATASATGSFAYNPTAGTVLAAGTYTLRVTFTPTDTSLYNTAAAQTTLVVNPPRSTPVITWPAPAPITQGTALGPAQLNATASAPGTFVYSPAAGTVLATGTYTLRATLTPTDTTRYTTATASTSLTVAAATAPPPPPPGDGNLPIGAPYTLTVVRPSGGLVRGTHIKCGTNGTACTVTMPGPLTMTLQTKADRGYVFVQWTGHCSGTGAHHAGHGARFGAVERDRKCDWELCL